VITAAERKTIDASAVTDASPPHRVRSLRVPPSGSSSPAADDARSPIIATADIAGLPTRDALVAAGRSAFAERGYAGSSLTVIAAGADLTTGAFYRHFASKAEFYAVLLADYREDLEAELRRARSLRAQIEAWLVVARRHRGVVRVTQELTRVGTAEADAHRALRAAAAALLATRLQNGNGRSDPGPGALMVADVITQYVLMVAAGWIPERDPKSVAVELERLVKRGLYRR
jgi:AcrR family transcriptional regulator